MLRRVRALRTAAAGSSPKRKFSFLPRLNVNGFVGTRISRGAVSISVFLWEQYTGHKEDKHVDYASLLATSSASLLNSIEFSYWTVGCLSPAENHLYIWDIRPWFIFYLSPSVFRGRFFLSQYSYVMSAISWIFLKLVRISLLPWFFLIFNLFFIARHTLSCHFFYFFFLPLKEERCGYRGSNEKI